MSNRTIRITETKSYINKIGSDQESKQGWSKPTKLGWIDINRKMDRY